MANTRNDNMDRMGNKIPQGGSQNNTQGTGGMGSTSQGQGGNFNEQATQRNSGKTGSSPQGQDPVNRDREMNRDGKLGQGSSGAEQRTGSDSRQGSDDQSE